MGSQYYIRYDSEPIVVHLKRGVDPSWTPQEYMRLIGAIAMNIPEATAVLELYQRRYNVTKCNLLGEDILANNKKCEHSTEEKERVE